MTTRPEQQAVSRGRRTASQVATAALLLGVGTALAGTATWQVAGDGRLVLLLGIMDGETLAPLLWLVTSVCAVVLGVAGFRLFVIGYEPLTAAVAALSFADGEYLLTTDERGQDVLIFTSDGFRSCEGYGMNELVLPN